MVCMPIVSCKVVWDNRDVASSSYKQNMSLLGYHDMESSISFLSPLFCLDLCFVLHIYCCKYYLEYHKAVVGITIPGFVCAVAAEWLTPIWTPKNSNSRLREDFLDILIAVILYLLCVLYECFSVTEVPQMLLLKHEYRNLVYLI